MDALKAGRQDFFTSVVVPVHDLDAVDDGQRVVDEAGNPCALARIRSRNVPAQEWLGRLEPGERRRDFVARFLGAKPQQRNVHQPQAAATVQVGPAQSV